MDLAACCSLTSDGLRWGMTRAATKTVPNAQCAGSDVEHGWRHRRAGQAHEPLTVHTRLLPTAWEVHNSLGFTALAARYRGVSCELRAKRLGIARPGR